eukprot:TRINITY_DN10080_c0_g1_i2.p1 TRINITY_DN10080_c0_g1~~TRINITY_DN10080_c0_g1_i2.p1  ORF type:complete len:146 (-),score=16.84 TRINITY_DN10080_c0_g1_i2:93-530(-)
MFAIVGKKNNLLFRLRRVDKENLMDKKLTKFSEIGLFSSLDVLELLCKSSYSLEFQKIDGVDSCSVSCYVTPGNAKFILLHEDLPEEAVTNFFATVRKLYGTLIMSPFYAIDTFIASPKFGAAIKKALDELFASVKSPMHHSTVF